MTTEAELWSTLNRASRDLTDHRIAPPASEWYRLGRRRAHRRRAVVATTSIAVAVGAAALLSGWPTSRPGPQATYATDAPELGMTSAPIDAPAADRARTGHPDPPTSFGLLAEAASGTGTMAIFEAPHRNGQHCAVAAFKPPTINMGWSTHCAAADSAPFSQRDLTVLGTGPYEGLPGTAYGSAPTGTRRVTLTSTTGRTVAVHAWDAGQKYHNRAYWVAIWDLDSTGTTTARAYNAKGELLATEHTPD